jgi:hypothetical protein
VAVRRRLTGEGGRVLARYELRRDGDGDGRPVADLLTLEPGVEPAEAVPAVLTTLHGHRVVASPALGRRLVEAGARPWRHAHAMSRDLRRDPAPAAWLDPPLPAGFRLAPADRPAADLAAACAAAYPPEHPDRREESEEEESSTACCRAGRSARSCRAARSRSGRATAWPAP